jgi:hypothetical protein
MKITLRQLRSLIREMAFEKMSTPIGKPDESGIEYFKDKVHKTKKYFSSKSWSQKAQNIFKFIEAPIWVIPSYNLGYISSSRLHVLSFEEALDYINESNFSPEDVQNHLAKGGTVLLVNATDIRAGFWPTPWMTLHAIFDTAGYGVEGENLLLMTKKVLEDWFDQTLEQEIEELYGDVDSDENQNFHIKFGEALEHTLTMKSAIDGTLNLETNNDLIAELLTQSIVLPNGCKINQFHPSMTDTNMDYTDEDVNFINEKLTELQNLVNSLNARELVNDVFTGNIVQINVF